MGMKSHGELERLTVGAKIVAIFRRREDDGIVIVTDRKHPSMEGMLSIEVLAEGGRVDVFTCASHETVVQ